MPRIMCAHGEHSAEIHQAILERTIAPHFPAVIWGDLVKHYTSCPWCQNIISQTGEIDCEGGEKSEKVCRTNVTLELTAIQQDTFFTEDAATLDRLQQHINSCPYCLKYWKRSDLRTRLNNSIRDHLSLKERWILRVRIIKYKFLK